MQGQEVRPCLINIIMPTGSQKPNRSIVFSGSGNAVQRGSQLALPGLQRKGRSSAPFPASPRRASGRKKAFCCTINCHEMSFKMSFNNLAVSELGIYFFYMESLAEICFTTLKLHFQCNPLVLVFAGEFTHLGEKM